MTVTASPAKGLDATLGVAERLAAQGYAVVPHVSARLVRDAEHLREIVQRLRAAGVCETFVPAGDAVQPGRFPDAASLLSAMGELRRGFPEVGHHRLPGEPPPDQRRDDDPGDVREGADGDLHRQPDLLRPGDDRGPGSRACATAARSADLDRPAGHRRQPRPAADLDEDRPRRVRPLPARAPCMAAAARHADLQAGRADPARSGPSTRDPAAKVGGFHLYTFNEVERTERWRRESIERLRTAG